MFIIGYVNFLLFKVDYVEGDWVLFYPAVVWKVAWSSGGYRGWDYVMYRAWLLGERSGFGYVAEFGFGHEWWNFYEGFSDEFYYGYAPPIHAMKPKRFRDGGVIFFISKKPRGNLWYLVGVYGCAEILGKPVDVGVLWDHIPEQYRGEILELTMKKLKGEDLAPLEAPTYFLLRARKEYSTPMPNPIPISLPEDVGVKFLGSAMFKYLELDRALTLLDKAVENITSLLSIVERAGERLWADPIVAIRRLKKLREYLVKLAQTPIELPQQPKPSIHPTYSLRETVREEYLHYVFPRLPEKLIEDALAQNLDVIEKELKLAGRQVNIPDVGRVDILAYDKHGTPVVIEVKSGIADNSTLTQLLAYMSKIREKEGKEPRGIIVAEGFTRKLQQAVKLLNNIKLVKIAAKINIEKLEEI